MEIPRKIAFIHIHKTAGSYIVVEMAKILKLKEYEIKHSWYHMRRDWTKEELISFAHTNESQFVHNHIDNWDEEIIDLYKKNGWFIFTFIREPGDQLCSQYFYFEIQKRTNNTLDSYLKKRIKIENKGSEIPTYWKKLDYISVFTEKKFTSFLKYYFGSKHKTGEVILKSENKGYKYYYKK
jgi:hypothetical protein